MRGFDFCKRFIDSFTHLLITRIKERAQGAV